MRRRASPHPLSASSYEDPFRDHRARPASELEATSFFGGVRECGEISISWQVFMNLHSYTQNELSCTTWVSFSTESTLENHSIPSHNFQSISWFHDSVVLCRIQHLQQNACLNVSVKIQRHILGLPINLLNGISRCPHNAALNYRFCQCVIA